MQLKVGKRNKLWEVLPLGKDLGWDFQLHITI